MVHSFLIKILPVNYAPTFSLIGGVNLCGCDRELADSDLQRSTSLAPNRVVLLQNDLKVQNVSGFAFDISRGDFMEDSQRLSFELVVIHEGSKGLVPNENASNSSSMFTVQPSISEGGELIFQLAQDAYGRVTFNVTAVDSGGTERGGKNRSAVHVFTIDVLFVNQAPSFDLANNTITVLEDQGPYNMPKFALNVLAGPLHIPDEGLQLVTFAVEVVGDGTSLFAFPPRIAQNGTLEFETARDQNGVATCIVTLHDSGGVALGGISRSIGI